MLRFGKSAIFVLALSLMAQPLFAQDVKIGNGRLLKKWRDDVFGSSEQKKTGAGQTQRQQPTLANPQRTSNSRVQPAPNQGSNQAPNQASNQGAQYRQSGNASGFRQPASSGQRLTPAQQQYQMRVEAQRRAEMLRRQQSAGRPQQQQVQRQLQQPTPASHADYYRQRTASPAPTAGDRAALTAQPHQKAPQPVSSQLDSPRAIATQAAPRAEHEPNRQPNFLSKAAAQIDATQKAKRRGPPAVGFGLELAADKEENVYVSNVDRNGNAAEAGIKKGDYVLEIGGAKIGSVAEFDEIVKVMSNGDQLELKTRRRGRESEVLLTFGEALEVDETAQEIDITSQSPETSATVQSNQRSGDDRFEFVPPTRSLSEKSDSSAPSVNPDAFDAPSPSELDAERPELPALELDLPEIPQNDSILDID